MEENNSFLSIAHINALATYYDEIYTPDEKESYGGAFYGWDAERVGCELHKEHIEDVKHQFQTQEIAWIKPATYHYQHDDELLRHPNLSILILKFCNCYVHYSCTRSKWHGSAAKRIIEIIKEDAIVHLPGYDELPWEYIEG